MLLVWAVFYLLFFNTVQCVFKELYCTIADTCECDFKPNIRGKTIRYLTRFLFDQTKQSGFISDMFSSSGFECFLAVLLCDNLVKLRRTHSVHLVIIILMITILLLKWYFSRKTLFVYPNQTWNGTYTPISTDNI